MCLCKFKTMLTLLSLVCLLFEGAALAQTGRWVEYDLAGFGTGGGVYDRGDGCLAYTKENSRYFAIFDVRVGEWLTVDMGSVQAFEFVQTRGDVVMGWSQTMLVAYSSIKQTWDTLTYDGTVLYTSSDEINRSYNCSDKLAFFATDEKLYVFDTFLGYWQDYAFNLPGSFVSGKYYVKEDYVALVLSRSESFSMPKNVVYSAHTRSFNELEYGARVFSPITDHGFMSYTNTDGMGDAYVLVGYSAFSNEFDVLNYDATDEACQAGFLPTSGIADEYTSYGLGFRRVVTPSVEVTCDFYGYDTYNGSWASLPVSFDWTVESYYGNSHIGGQFAVDFSTLDGGVFNYFFYSGVDGSFKVKSPGIHYKSTYYGFRCGGSVYMCYDTLNAWGYDLVGDRDSYIALDLYKSANLAVGEDWGAFTRYTPGEEDTMLVYFYNGNTNDWKVAVMPYDLSISEETSPHYYMYNDWNTGEFIYYSSKTDEITKLNFTPETSVSCHIQGDLAYARSDERTYLFDGVNETITSRDFNFNGNGLGLHSGAFYESDSKTLYGYSTVTGNWTERTITEDLCYCFDTGYVGCISVYYNGNGFNKQYAYNGFGDSWVENIPEGTHVGLLVGEKTILVARSTKLYAFDPQSEILCCRGMTGNVDCSESEDPDITDIVRLIDFLYLSHNPLCCPEEADTDGSGGDPDITDIVKIIDHLYLSHEPLVDCP
ncbi:MAG: hypothetical protein JXA92_08495 [candidate division Zixibacteria bacterium]|nr:hypothetical protein [candidate division Zixibacteria bacterium]